MSTAGEMLPSGHYGNLNAETNQVDAPKQKRGRIMRLSPIQKQAICESALRYFGKEAQIWLFGSRVDDTRKGGDIDLYIETPAHNAEELITAKLQFLCELHKKIGEQKIDIVLHRSGTTVDLPIYRIAKQTGVRLQ